MQDGSSKLLCVYCKAEVGDPGYPGAAVERGRQVIVDLNSSMQVADHDWVQES